MASLVVLQLWLIGQSWGESHSEEGARRSKFHLDLQLLKRIRGALSACPQHLLSRPSGLPSSQAPYNLKLPLSYLKTILSPSSVPPCSHWPVFSILSYSKPCECWPSLALVPFLLRPNSGDLDISLHPPFFQPLWCTCLLPYFPTLHSKNSETE